GDGSQILATVKIAGGLRSAFCDTQPGPQRGGSSAPTVSRAEARSTLMFPAGPEAGFPGAQASNGIITAVNVFLNGGETPLTTIPTAPSKSSQDSFLRPFPFSATFTKTLEDLVLTSGNNVFKITAADPTGVTGCSAYSVFIEGTPPAGV